MLRLERFNYGPADPNSHGYGTFGRLQLPNGEMLYTVERSWEGNKAFASCIPEGVYKLSKRRSGVVERTTSGEYLEGWEVTAVPDRTYIILHVANYPREVEGCIGVGLGYGVMAGQLAVTNSLPAFRLFMDALEGADEHELHILPHLITYP